MKLCINPKPAPELNPTDILFQTSFWGRVKSRLGWQVSAFDISMPSATGDVLVLTKRLGDASSTAYVPQGPEQGPDPEAYGPFLEKLSKSLLEHLGPSLAFIRYDLPWIDPYAIDAEAAKADASGLHRPDDRLRELRMNFATREWSLRKAPFDLTVADSLLVDLTGTEDEILGRMKPKTRYNIHLAHRKGAHVVPVNMSALPIFYDLYLQTTQRNGFLACDYAHFAALFESATSRLGSPHICFYLAERGHDTLAGAIVAISQCRATYLFGASANHYRNLMGSYAIQWHAMQAARAMGCTVYDMGAVSPRNNPTHPFYGMYRFKTGFGGRIEHRAGSWDYLFNPGEYETLRNREMLREVFDG